MLANLLSEFWVQLEIDWLLKHTLYVRLFTECILGSSGN